MLPNRFRVLDCIIERTGKASSVSGSLSESESNPLVDRSSQLDTIPNSDLDTDPDTDPDTD
ncbi:MAG TPA: hypothetical protein DIW77_04295 [Chromatiaceae bacterium]|nr:hypothetical protein [Chromatiaceae bacterium]